MKFISSFNKKNLMLILLLIIVPVFISGFIVGDKYGESIAVLNQREVPIYKVDRTNNLISLTLDGTWGATHTEELLEIFRENDIKVTFFFAGYWLKKYPSLVKKIAMEGHEIGNHTYSHPHCNNLTKEELKKELEKTSNLINNLTGIRPVFFRPPFGEYNNLVVETARELGYIPIQWSLDSLDWQEPGVEKIIERIESMVSSGDIILMHNNAPDTPDALKKIIPNLKKKGFEFVALSNLVYKDNYLIQSHNGLQIKLNGSK